jgi:hypothetical protein
LTSFTVMALPAIARYFEWCRNLGDDVVRCEGDFFVENDDY